MKKVIFALLFLAVTVSFTSCTDLTGNDETIFETQATDKDDSVNPNNNGEECDDPTDPLCD